MRHISDPNRPHDAYAEPAQADCGKTSIRNSSSSERWPTVEILRPMQSCLTTRDYFALENFLIELAKRQGHEAEHLARLVRTKLADTSIVLSEDVPSDVATASSRVSYSINDGAPRTRTLIAGETVTVPGSDLPFCSLTGLGLIGMRVRQSMPWFDHEGNIVRIELVGIEFQPEARRRSALLAVNPARPDNMT